MKELEITLPLPPRACHPNARPHWVTKATAKAKQRADAMWAAKAIIGFRESPQWATATCQATFYLSRKSDGDNLLSWLKASLDGLQDAGIVANDAGLIHMPVKQVLDAKRNGKRAVVLRLTETLGMDGR